MKTFSVSLVLAAGIAMSSAAFAQIPVTDGASIAQQVGVIAVAVGVGQHIKPIEHGHVAIGGVGGVVGGQPGVLEPVVEGARAGGLGGIGGETAVIRGQCRRGDVDEERVGVGGEDIF